MPEQLWDLFISHAGKDKARYVTPLANALASKQITFWLDDIEIGWGDSIPRRINDGLRKSRYVLLCLSRNFLQRPWPEAELASALAIQNATGKMRVLPLILNSKQVILSTYPLLAGIVYKDYSDPLALADELVALIKPEGKQNSDRLHVTVESIHTGKTCNIYVSPRASIKWLVDQAQKDLGLSDQADVGAYEPFRVKWVLVDARAEDAWNELHRGEKRELSAVLYTSIGPQLINTDRYRIEDSGISDGTVFHLYAIEDERYDPPAEAGI
jgi:hypothetical protein